MHHNIRGVKMTPTSRQRNKIGLPVEGLMLTQKALPGICDELQQISVLAVRLEWWNDRNYCSNKSATTFYFSPAFDCI